MTQDNTGMNKDTSADKKDAGADKAKTDNPSANKSA